MERLELEALLEAVLFAQGDPVGADKLAAALELPEARVAAGLEALQKRYEAPSSGLTLLHLGDHWQLATKNQYGPLGAQGPGNPPGRPADPGGPGNPDGDRLQPAGVPGPSSSRCGGWILPPAWRACWKRGSSKRRAGWTCRAGR